MQLLTTKAVLQTVALMLQGPNWHDEDFVPLCVLQHVLGGGDAFSAGGPGKGMHSRLYREVLNQFWWVERVHATGYHYTGTGVFGLCFVSHDME